MPLLAYVAGGVSILAGGLVAAAYALSPTDQPAVAGAQSYASYTATTLPAGDGARPVRIISMTAEPAIISFDKSAWHRYVSTPRSVVSTTKTSTTGSDRSSRTSRVRSEQGDERERRSGNGRERGARTYAVRREGAFGDAPPSRDVVVRSFGAW
jgi:hypothetical protein